MRELVDPAATTFDMLAQRAQRGPPFAAFVVRAAIDALVRVSMLGRGEVLVKLG